MLHCYSLKEIRVSTPAENRIRNFFPCWVKDLTKSKALLPTTWPRTSNFARVSQNDVNVCSRYLSFEPVWLRFGTFNIRWPSKCLRSIQLLNFWDSNDGRNNVAFLPCKIRLSTSVKRVAFSFFPMIWNPQMNTNVIIATVKAFYHHSILTGVFLPHRNWLGSWPPANRIFLLTTR